MDNQDNLMCQMNPIPNIGMYSPNKYSKNNNQFLYNQSPFPSKIMLFNTPNKLCEGTSIFPSMGDTPPKYLNYPISPITNNQKDDLNFQNFHKNFSDYKNFEGLNFTDKKTECKINMYNNRNDYYGEIRGINLAERFNAFEMKNGNEKMGYDNHLIDNNRKDSEIINNNIWKKDEGYDIVRNKENKNINNNRSIKNSLFGNENMGNIDNNNNEIIEDKISTIIVNESVLDDIKNVFGNNLSKKEYVFNSLNSSIISNFSFSPNDISSHSQSITQNQFSAPVPLPITFSEIKQYHKKPPKNTDIITSYNNTSTNISSTCIKCTCKNSNCFKLYCECFANGKYCDNCSCSNCKNTIDNKELRAQKYDEIISRNPKALQKINSTKRSWTCKCKNSNCLKKYCDCLQNGRCCTSKCKCINCFNKNSTYHKNHGGDRKYKVKRIRGIKNYNAINRELIRQNNENEINEEDEDEENIKDTKKKMINLTTPKKSKNHLDKNEIYIYYNKNESSTAAMTGKKERRKIMETRSENKNKNIYTKLQMDII